MSLMIDTNICVYLITGRHREVVTQFMAHWEEACISSITLAELEFGVAKSSRPQANRESLKRFVANMPVMAFGAEQTRAYGKIKAALSRAGTMIGPLDTLIAAHALSLDHTLVTNNRRELDRVPGLKVDNWV